MGDRGNIVIQEENGNKIYFYTHWQGSYIKNILKAALIRGENRWNDCAYLSRIIFCEMIKDDVLGETGNGISTTMCDNEHNLLVVDVKEQKVYLTKEDFSKQETWSFEEFIKDDTKLEDLEEEVEYLEEDLNNSDIKEGR